jgi:hypothetical protein
MHEALSWAVGLLHHGLNSIDYTTQTQISGVELSYIELWRLCSEVRNLEVPLKRLAVHCPYTYPSTPEKEGPRHAILSIAGIHSLTSLSITGSLCNEHALLSFAALPYLSTLEVMGGPTQDIRGAALGHNSFPALSELCLRYFDEKSTSRMCSISSLLRRITSLEIQWDLHVKPGVSGIDLTLAHIAINCSRLQKLRLELYSAKTVGKEHHIPHSVWRNLRSESVTSVTMIGFATARDPDPRSIHNLKGIWPNLAEFANSSQPLGHGELKYICVPDQLPTPWSAHQTWLV